MADPAATAEAEDIAQETFDASDPKQVNEARKRAGRTRRADLEFIQGVMDIKQGRSWIYRKLEECHIFEPSFNPDPYRTAFREGERNIGNRILADIMAAAPERYVTMIAEAKAP